MRKTLAIKEGELLPDGRLLLDGSLHTGGEFRVPITWALDTEKFQPIGWASDMERDHELVHVAVSFEMIMQDQDFDLDLYNVYPFCTDLEERTVDLRDEGLKPQTIVGNARIRCLQLVPIPGIAFVPKPKPPDE
jgi:hypothetical protein